MRALRTALLLPLLASCATDAAPTYSGPYADVLDSLCEVLDRCPTGVVGVPLAYRSRRECADILNWAFTCRLTRTEVGDTTRFGIEQHIPEVSREMADACTAWLEAAACEDVTGDSSGANPCAPVLAGLVADPDDDESRDTGGGLYASCDGTYDCAEDFYCAGESIDPTTGAWTCAVCTPRRTTGEECDSTDRICAEGFFCLSDGGTPTCERLYADGDVCSQSTFCASGFCNMTEPGRGTCDPLGHEDDACTDASDCRTGLFCDAGTCQPQRDGGEACTADEQCAMSNCDEPTSICGLPDGATCGGGWECAAGVCSTSGTCGGSTAGLSCSSDADCSRDERCSWRSFTCAPPLADGSACDRDEECASEHCTSSDVCGPRPAAGDPCSNSVDCGPAAFCEGGTCRPRIAPGEACSGIDSCAYPFLCQNGRCELINLSCQPAPAGQQCAFLMVCDETSYCDLYGGSICRPRAGEGQACSTTLIRIGVEECQAGLVCAASPTGDSQCRRPTPLGAACTAPNECAAGSYCFAGTCQADPVGRPCDYDAPCPAPLFCDDEICRPPGGVGVRCSGAEECEDGLHCDFPYCAERLALGERCSDNEECEASLRCDTSAYTCQPRLAPGAACRGTYDEDCAAGHHCDGDSCEPQRAPGGECSSGSECTSGYCNAGRCLATDRCVVPAGS
jgi:hypothetical protein